MARAHGGKDQGLVPTRILLSFKPFLRKSARLKDRESCGNESWVLESRTIASKQSHDGPWRHFSYLWTLGRALKRVNRPRVIQRSGKCVWGAPPSAVNTRERWALGPGVSFKETPELTLLDLHPWRRFWFLFVRNQSPKRLQGRSRSQLTTHLSWSLTFGGC